MEQPNKISLWKTLEEHAHSIRLRIPQQLTETPDIDRQWFNASACNIQLDYSHQHVTTQILEHLFALAEACGLRDKIHALMHGGIVNISENKPALHTALRAPDDTVILVNQQDIMPDIIATHQKMQAIV